MDFNSSKSVMDLMFLGRLFHNFGAIFSKALSPNVLDFTHIHVHAHVMSVLILKSIQV